MGAVLKKGDLILFQGDSVTDCGRNRENPNDLACGYAMMIAAWLSALHPELDLKFINRGISGDRTKDLLNRWDKDCVSLKPNLVSFLVGINNTWRRYDSNDPTPLEQFEKEYRTLLKRVKEETNAKIVLCEPFFLPITEEQKTWREDLNPKIEAIHKLAKEFKAILVPLDEIFNKAASKFSAKYWAGDGVHPTLAGHALIAQSWIKYVK
jgi:acyl-CoA thioesterase I